MKKDSKSIRIGTFVILLVLFSFPFLARPHQISLLTEIIIFSLYAVSYNLLLGFGGLLSFGHGMFLGVGAFTTGAMLQRIPGLPFFGYVFLGTLMATLIGLGVGCLLLRHKGAYYALLTLAFNALFYAIAIKWHAVTGGDDGLPVKRPNLHLGFVQLPMSDVTVFYYVTLVVIGCAVLFCWYFTKTAMGKTVLLLRENEERMQFIGYNPGVSRMILFSLTAFFAGLAGSFYALFFKFVGVDAIGIDMTTTALLMTFIGGTKDFFGPVLGAGFYIYFQNYLSNITDRWPLFMGILFVLMVLFAPRGLSGLIRSLVELFRKTGNGKATRKEDDILGE
ncbi:MAG: branched-chain amino acid ABC transporter permease [Desulfobacterales bacterium]|nr:branched-chain amino acid ABC transporter permease [Desulfobacterales bacterium]